MIILRKLVVGPYASNCYIVGSDSSKEGILIDAGDEADKILSNVEELELKIKYLVLTHGHIDHIGALEKVREATGALVAVHTDDARFIQEQLPNVAPPDKLLNGGDNIDFAEGSFLVIHTPGHSPGSICLLGHGVLFSGDTLFNYGIGRYDTPGGSYAQIMNSIHAKLMVLPSETVVYPGHGPETTIGDEHQGNPFLRG